MELLTKVRTLMVNGKEQQIVDFVNKLENETVLPDGLQEALDKLGNNPIKEPELYTLIQDLTGSAYRLEIAEKVIGDDVDNYTATEIGKFIYEVEQHITSLKNKDGDYKTTDATANCNMPRMRASQKIGKLGDEFRKLQEKIKEGKDIEKFTQEIKDLDREMGDIIWAETGLKADDLSDWEQTLVMSMVSNNTTEALLSSMGKQLPN